MCALGESLPIAILFPFDIKLMPAAIVERDRELFLPGASRLGLSHEADLLLKEIAEQHAIRLRSAIWINSKAREFITVRPSWKRSSVNERTWRLSVAATPRDKRLFFFRKQRARYTCSYAPVSCRIRCRAISFSASKKILPSSCTTRPKSSDLRATRTSNASRGETR